MPTMADLSDCAAGFHEYENPDDPDGAPLTECRHCGEPDEPAPEPNEALKAAAARHGRQPRLNYGPLEPTGPGESDAWMTHRDGRWGIQVFANGAWGPWVLMAAKAEEQPITTRRVCVLSTLHLTEAATLAMLARPLEDWDCSGGQIGFGFYLYAHDEFDKADAYPDLARLYAWARARSFDYIQLDTDEDPRDDLPARAEDQVGSVAGQGDMATKAQYVWIVEGEHFHVPGRVVNTYGSEDAANRAAAALVNLLVEHVNDMAGPDSDMRTVPEMATPQNWTAILKMAQFAYWAADTPLEDLDGDYDYQAHSEGWVTITAQEVKA